MTVQYKLYNLTCLHTWCLLLISRKMVVSILCFQKRKRHNYTHPPLSLPAGKTAQHVSSSHLLLKVWHSRCNLVKQFHLRLIGICKSIVSCNSVRKLTWSALRQFPWYLDPGYPKIAQWVDRSLPECCSPPPRYLLGVRLGWEKSGKTLQTR